MCSLNNNINKNNHALACVDHLRSLFVAPSLPLQISTATKTKIPFTPTHSTPRALKSRSPSRCAPPPLTTWRTLPRASNTNGSSFDSPDQQISSSTVISSTESAVIFENSGAPLVLRGRVAHGFGRGSRKLGFPTANYDRNDADISALLPKPRGVYFGWAAIEGLDTDDDEAKEEEVEEDGADDGVVPVVLNYGVNPTFGDVEVALVEAHVMAPVREDFYGAWMTIVVVGFLREERKFEQFQHLVANIRNDAAVASGILETRKSLPQFQLLRETLLHHHRQHHHAQG